MKPGGGLARHQSRATGGTNGAGCVAARESNAILCKRINVRRLVKIASGAGQIGPPHVVDEKEDDVLWCGYRG
jgi:hypothetical protein